ncbi:MAG: hypothetical protein LBU72_00340 [Burkholderiaceae bacterium]|jgi:hypothetical protein|nr:hypothetical protein [Burkholderiaceae bacterium]
MRELNSNEIKVVSGSGVIRQVAHNTVTAAKQISHNVATAAKEVWHFIW